MHACAVPWHKFKDDFAHVRNWDSLGSESSPRHRMASQLYGISFLSLAVCDGAEYAVNERQFFLPGRLKTFRWEWPACAYM